MPLPPHLLNLVPNPSYLAELRYTGRLEMRQHVPEPPKPRTLQHSPAIAAAAADFIAIEHPVYGDLARCSIKHGVKANAVRMRLKAMLKRGEIKFLPYINPPARPGLFKDRT